MTQTTRTISVVCFARNGIWVAQCLEIDICTQAERFNDLLDSLKRVVLAHFQVGTVDTAAPKNYWEKFRSGIPLKDPVIVKDTKLLIHIV